VPQLPSNAATAASGATWRLRASGGTATVASGSAAARQREQRKEKGGGGDPRVLCAITGTTGTSL
jgi:hypothetical protein